MGSKSKALLNRYSELGVTLALKIFSHPNVAKTERRGRKLGELLFRLDRKHRERTISNLRLAFPDWPEQKIGETAINVFRHFGITTADFFRSPLRSNEELLANMEFEGFEYFEEALSLGKGVLVTTAHLGNWERFGHWAIAKGYRICVVARDANQSGVQKRVAEIRAKTGMDVLSRGDSAREILRRLKRNEMIGLLSDQNSEEAYVPFFNKLAGTVLGPAVLHIRTGAPILPAFCVRTGVGRYRMIVLPLIDPKNENTDPQAISTQVNAALESVVRRYPEQWLWMHDRWKSARLEGLL